MAEIKLIEIDQFLFRLYLYDTYLGFINLEDGTSYLLLENPAFLLDLIRSVNIELPETGKIIH
jgi:hypothetical protein